MTTPDWPGEVPRKPNGGLYGSLLRPDKTPTSRYWPSKASKRAAKKAAREGNSVEHLAMLGQLWCTLSFVDAKPREAIHLHHLQGGPCAHMRRRTPDRWAVPLAWWRHEELHAMGSRHELEYFKDHSKGRIDPYALALALWSASPSLAMARRILIAHQNKDEAGKLLLGLEQAELIGHNGGPPLTR
jgi:hypothetical protein